MVGLNNAWGGSRVGERWHRYEQEMESQVLVGAIVLLRGKPRETYTAAHPGHLARMCAI